MNLGTINCYHLSLDLNNRRHERIRAVKLNRLVRFEVILNLQINAGVWNRADCNFIYAPYGGTGGRPSLQQCLGHMLIIATDDMEQ